MSSAERLALVPWEETKRETKECIVTLTELIAEDEDELKAKRQEIKGKIADLRKCRARLIRKVARL